MLTGLIGYPIEKTPSPAMHNAAYKYLGIDGRYVRLAVKRNALKSAIKDLIRSGFQGVNITIPYKQAVLEYLDSMSKTAIKINAVNTIMIKNGRLIGENTDVDGFQRSLAYHHVKIRDKRILLIDMDPSTAWIRSLDYLICCIEMHLRSLHYWRGLCTQ